MKKVFAMILVMLAGCAAPTRDNGSWQEITRGVGQELKR